MTRKTREWVKKAESDYRVAVRLAPDQPPAHDMVCFCCQQSAEKYLKALLEEANQPIPRTHHLEDLRHRLSTAHPSLKKLNKGFQYLFQFAVDARYPGFHTTKRQAQSALLWAGRIRLHVRLLLGLRTPKK